MANLIITKEIIKRIEAYLDEDEGTQVRFENNEWHFSVGKKASLVEAFCRVLINLEETPVKFGNQEITQQQKELFSSYLSAVDAVKEYLKNYLSEHPSEKIAAQLLQLDRYVVGFKYRIEAVHGGLDKSTVKDINAELVAKVSSWKSRQTLFLNKQLSDEEKRALEPVYAYPEFVKLLLKDKDLLSHFLKWLLRDGNGVDQFVQFPATMRLMTEAFINKQVAFVNKDALAIQSVECKDGVEKDILLPFYDGKEKRQVSILNVANTITLNKGWSISVFEMIQICADKNKRPGKIEYFKNGFENFDTYEMGAWNPSTKTYDRINFEAPEWWRQLPTKKTYTKEEVEEKCKLKLQPGAWVKAVAAARETPDYKALGRHGYLEIYIPASDGKYTFYSFGLFAKDFPEKLHQQAALIVKTVEARVGYDQNPAYLQRQHAKYPKAITCEQGQALMESIRKDILLGLSGNLNFQVGAKNCAYWAGEKFADHENPDNVFCMLAKDMQNTDWYLRPLLTAPATVRRKFEFEFLGKYSFLLSASSELMVKGLIVALLNTPALMGGRVVARDDNKCSKYRYEATFFGLRHGKITQYQPGWLFTQIEQGKIPGVISFGAFKQFPEEKRVENTVVAKRELPDNATPSISLRRT